MAISLDPGETTATTFWPIPLPSDSSGSVTLTCSHDRPSHLELGDTVVSYEARDSDGNVATCDFTVTVVDNVPPVIACPEDITAGVHILRETVNVTWATPAISDGGGDVTVTSSHDPGSDFYRGKTVVSYEAVDPSGNAATCNFTVTVGAPFRIVGDLPNKGRVQVYLNGQWGRVFNEFWGSTETRILCRELGYPDEDGTPIMLTLIDDMPVLMNDLLCPDDSLPTLLDCPYSSSWEGADATVECEVRVRLSNGLPPYQDRTGIVEVYHEGYWGMLCASEVDLEDGAEICHALGFLGVSSIIYDRKLTVGLWMSESGCSGTGMSILDCPHGKIGCNEEGAAFIICQPFVRLVGGTRPYEGFIEAYRDDTWFPISDLFWDQWDAQVACRELGFPQLIETTKTHSVPSRLSTMYRIACFGNEWSLFDCPWSTFYDERESTLAVYVDCSAPFGMTMLPDGMGYTIVYRLGGDAQYMSYENWDINDADVMCREVGYAMSVAPIYTISYFPAKFLSDVDCFGTEDSLFHCYHKFTYVEDSDYVAGARCSSTPEFTDLYWPLDEEVPTPTDLKTQTVTHGDVEFVSINHAIVASVSDGDWIDLGVLLESCLEDINACTNHVFTLSFWFKADRMDRDQTILALSNERNCAGISFEYVWSHYEVSMATCMSNAYNSKTRSVKRVSIEGAFPNWSEITLLAAKDNGLEVYIDGEKFFWQRQAAPGDTKSSNHFLRVGQQMRKALKSNEFYLDEIRYVEKYLVPSGPVNAAHRKQVTLQSGSGAIDTAGVSTEHAVDGFPGTYLSVYVASEGTFLQIDMIDLRTVSHVVVHTADKDQHLKLAIGRQSSSGTGYDITDCGSAFQVPAHSTYVHHCQHSILGRYALVEPVLPSNGPELRVSEVQLYYDPTYMGCFRISGDMDFETEEGYRIGQCRTVCAKKDYAYSGLTNSGKCSCRQSYEDLQITHSCTTFLHDMMATRRRLSTQDVAPTAVPDEEISFFMSGNDLTLLDTSTFYVLVRCHSNSSDRVVFLPMETIACHFHVTINESDFLVRLEASDETSVLVDSFIPTKENYTMYFSYPEDGFHDLFVKVSFRAEEILLQGRIEVRTFPLPLMASLAPSNSGISNKSGDTPGNYCITEDQFAFKDELASFTTKYLESDEVRCTIDFGDGQEDAMILRIQERYVTFTHAYSETGRYSAVVECSNDYGNSSLTIERCVKQRIADFAIPPFSVENGEPVAITWEVPEENDVFFLLTLRNVYPGGSAPQRTALGYQTSSNVVETREYVLNYKLGAYTGQSMYSCRGFHVMQFLLYNSPQPVLHLTSHFYVADRVSGVHLDVGEVMRITDFTSLVFDNPEYGLQIDRGENLTITFSTENEEDITRLLSYGDEDQPDPGEITVYEKEETNEERRIHAYMEKDVYMLKLTAVNEAGLSLFQYALNVFSPCETPMVWINGYGKSRGKPRKEYRSSKIIVSSLVMIFCRDESMTEAAKYIWTAKRLVDDGTQEDIPVDQSGTTSLAFDPKTFEYGLVRVALTVRIKSKMILEVGRDRVYMEIGRAPPVAAIVGGVARSSPLYRDVVLDASVSYDPEASTDNYRIEWRCRLEHTDYDDTLSPQGVNLDPCGIDSGGYHLSKGTKTLTVYSNYVTLGNYIFSATIVAEDGARTACEQNVEITEGPNAEIAISCVQNCHSTVGSSFAMSFQVICVRGFCQNEDGVSFVWKLHEDNTSETRLLLHSRHEDLFFMGNHGSSLILHGGFLKKGSEYMLTALLNGTQLVEEVYTRSSFKTAWPPYGGTCEIIPKHGYAFSTQFVVRCDGWRSGVQEDDESESPDDAPELLSQGLMYRMRLSSNDIPYGGDIYFASDPLTPGMALPEGPPENDHSWDLIIKVENKYKEYSLLSLLVKVLPSEGSLVNASILINEYLTLGNAVQANQMVMSIAATLKKKNQDLSGVNIDKLKKDMGRALELSTRSFPYPESVYQAATTLEMAANEPSQLDEMLQDTMITALSRMSSAVLRMRKKSYIPRKNILLCSKDMVASSAHLLDAIHRPSVPRTEEESDTPGNDTQDSNVPGFTNAIVDSLVKVAETVFRGMVPGEPTINISTDGLSLHLEKATEEELDNKEIAMTRSSFSLPSSRAMFPQVNHSSIGLKVVEYKRNIFSWDVDSHINSSVVSVELYDENSTLISQDNSTEYFAYTMEIPEQGKSNDSVSDVSTLDSAEIPLYYTLNISYTDAGTRLFLSVPTDVNTTFAIHVGFDYDPTAENFDFRFLVPSSGVLVNVMGTALPSMTSNLDPIQADATPEIVQRSQSEYKAIAINATTHEVFIPSDYINVTGPCNVFIAEFTSLNDTGYPSLGRPLQPYAFKIETATCQYWNTGTERWTTTGCKVDPYSRPGETTCLCNHLTSFGLDSFYVPVNTITWHELSFSDLLENPLVISIVCAIFAVYFILLVYMRRKDKEDLYRWGATPLIDNCKRDRVIYRIAVCTGDKGKAGTRSNIYFRLVGEKGATGIRQLKGEFGKVFSSGSVNHFLMAVPKTLGELQYLHIWHDSAGYGDDASWFLNRITITDVQSGKWYTFLCNRWLAVDVDDCKIDRILPVAGKDNLLDFNENFVWRRQKSLTDDHLWFSLFLRPTQSIFTRVERLSCCLSLLFASLISNAMFYRTDSEAEKMTYTRVEFGPIRFSLQQVYIGTVSTLVVLPVNLIIINIFRKSRRCSRVDACGCLRRTRAKKCCRGETHGSEPKVALKVDRTQISENRAAFMLPWWFIYIGWALVFLVTTISASFVIMYSMEWGKEKSTDWISSSGASLFESMILIEPMKAIIVAYILSLLLRSPDPGDDADKSTKKQNEQIEQEYEENQLPYHSVDEYDSPFAPLKHEDMELVKQRRVREKQMMAVMYGILVYSVFVGVTMVLCHHTRHPMLYDLNRYIRNTYISGDQNFMQIRTPDEFWHWLEGTFIESAYPSSKKAHPHVTADWQSFRVGSIRLRQQRNQKGNCYIPSDGNECELFDETERAQFLPGWEPYNKYIKSDTQQNLSSTEEYPWTHQNSSSLRGTYYFGNHHIYGIDGYVAILPDNKKSALNYTKWLAKNYWLDPFTEAVFVEFDLYHQNVDIFSSMTLALEILPTGNANARISQKDLPGLQIFSGDFVGNDRTLTIFFCWLLFGVFGIVLLVSLMRRILKQRGYFLRLPWNYFDTSLTLATFASLVLLVICDRVKANALKETLEGTGENLQGIAALSDFLNHVIAGVAFLSVIRFLKLLRFNRRMMLMSKTIRAVGDDIISYIVLIFLTNSACAHAGYLAFNTSLELFKSFREAMELLFIVSVGKFPRFQGHATESASANADIVIFLFGFFNVAIRMNIFIAIITEGFSQAREDMQNTKNRFEMFDYITTRLKDRAITMGFLKEKESERLITEPSEEDALVECEKRIIHIDNLVNKWILEYSKYEKRATQISHV
ncbi:polycystin family receptor for egg jelly-like [Ptychodera flava]|uniref:polycystin family receptor for egg jelly-like n=1 Tax=Ptychodera flava TaxID=63121 RepID=UPI003969F4C1